jgi:hypothetical protein
VWVVMAWIYISEGLKDDGKPFDEEHLSYDGCESENLWDYTHR